MDVDRPLVVHSDNSDERQQPKKKQLRLDRWKENSDFRICSSYLNGAGEVERSGTEKPPEDCCLRPYSQTSHDNILQLQTQSLRIISFPLLLLTVSNSRSRHRSKERAHHVALRRDPGPCRKPAAQPSPREQKRRSVSGRLPVPKS